MLNKRITARVIPDPRSRPEAFQSYALASVAAIDSLHRFESHKIFNHRGHRVPQRKSIQRSRDRNRDRNMEAENRSGAVDRFEIDGAVVPLQNLISLSQADAAAVFLRGEIEFENFVA
jgi:hypothetical protein